MAATRPQQEFLRDAMRQLGMTREQFCKRISVPRKTLDKWLSPDGSIDKRAMPDMAWAYINEILRGLGANTTNHPKDWKRRENVEIE
jgi:transcriptional regulator with XRE-family HTH domain